MYDTPPMVVKGPSSGQEIYNTPTGTDKNMQQMVTGRFLDLISINICTLEM